MGLRKRLLLLAGTLAVFNLVLWGLPQLAPEVPGRYEGVAGPTSQRPTDSAVRTTAPPLPSGFPSMERPPQITVGDGEPQPITTKYGLTYNIPAGWDNWSDGVAGWDFDDGSSVVFGSLGFYARTECSDGEYTELAMTGMTGRRMTDLVETARIEVERADLIFSGSDEPKKATVTITGPHTFSIGDRPAVRYRATATDIPEAAEKCRSSSATFDVITTPGYASAETVVFVVHAARGVEDALTDSDIDQLISTIRRS
ncbi:hypothetical protein [Rhodococcoides kyotonense]|uniref:DUF8017 domain-containing protein n=1 Tax=Rhodococcoides kyotonense TaxID=398843 RepID=A0A239LCV5_9NOCA|nr:hypothetical protein [Rhodococcus kyotonensis]SNT27792.1 hypothetical protein SAMN05421642_112187 [Rhodococcus kyotonensis]